MDLNANCIKQEISEVLERKAQTKGKDFIYLHAFTPIYVCC